jgi:hypothetical protein
MFKIKQHIEYDKNYNILYLKETINNIVVFWERYYYVDNEIKYSRDSNNYEYLYKNNRKVNQKPIEYIDPYNANIELDVVDAYNQALALENGIIATSNWDDRYSNDNNIYQF